MLDRYEADGFIKRVCDTLGVSRIGLEDGLMKIGDGKAVSTHQIATRRGDGVCLIVIRQCDRYFFEINARLVNTSQTKVRGRKSMSWEWEITCPMGDKETDRVIEILRSFFG